MTLGVGDNVAKLKAQWNGFSGEDSAQVVVDPPEIVQGEAYHQFEVLHIDGNQGDPDGFTVALKVVK